MHKKNISILLVLVMLTYIFPIQVYANESVSKIYQYNNYNINYNIINSWDNSQNIEIKITNTSEEQIENWMLSYDFCGEIQGIWNAEIKTTEDGGVYIKNAGYNCVIEPGCSVNFGYTLAEAEGFPSGFSMCQERVSKTDGYEVTLNVIDSWEDNSFQGEIVITNNTDAAIECWELDIDSNFTIAEITNSWAATVLVYDDGKYTLKGTYTNIIYPNSSTTLGFLGVKNGEPEIYDYSFTEVILKNNISDIGEMYFKDIQSENDIEYDGNGIHYVRNQLLLTARDGVTFDEIDNLAKSINASVVGYIEVVNDYQIEFNYDLSTEELYAVINKLNNSSLVEYISLNTVSKVSPDYIPRDYDWCTQEEKDDYLMELKAINIDLAWDYFDEDIFENAQRETVKIGLMDTMFSENHPDLKFEKIWNNPDIYNIAEISNHGTHVAGIMGALFNNEIRDSNGNLDKNIAGVCPKNQMYAYAFLSGAKGESKGKEISMIEFKYMFALFMAHNVRVVNLSLSTDTDICFAASKGNEKAKISVEKNAEIYQKYLLKFIDMGYDFVIITAAGNVNNNKYIIDPDVNKEGYEGYGYIKIDEETTVNDNILEKDVDAIYNSWFNYIQHPDVRSRIICVGSYGLDNKYSDFSNIGTRVDIVAPGEKIYSTIIRDEGTDKNVINQYKELHGTSMAAPYISGIAGMLYSINPNLLGEQVKHIITTTATKQVSTTTTDGSITYTYNIADAKAATDVAFAYKNGTYEEKYNGIILGTVIDEITGEPIEDVDINIYNISGNNFVESGYNALTDKDGIYECILPLGDYMIEYKKIGYGPQKQYVSLTNSVIQNEISLLPIEASIYGTVTVKNLTTGEEKPQANYTLRILKDGEEYMTATTQADGTYKAQVTEYGTYTIVCNPDNQSEHYIGMNGDFLANFTIEYEEEEDEEGNDDEESDDLIDVGEVDIVINFDNGENEQVTSPYIGSFEKGIYIQSLDGRYVHMYLDMSYEETTTDGLYYLRKGCITYDAYDANGNLIETTQCLSNGNWTWHKKGETISYSVKWVTIDLSRGAYYWVWSRWQGSKGDTASSYWDYPVKKVTLDIIHNAVKVSYTPPEIIA